MSILIGILTVILILVSFFLILIVLAQKAKNDGGMGAAMGGGMAEAAFGADTSNVLSKLTIYASVLFFVLSFVLYLSHIHQRKLSLEGGALPTIPLSVSPTPVNSAPAPAATSPAAAQVALPVAPAPAAPEKKP